MNAYLHTYIMIFELFMNKDISIWILLGIYYMVHVHNNKINLNKVIHSIDISFIQKSYVVFV